MISDPKFFWKKLLLAIVPLTFAIFVMMGLFEREFDNSVLLLVTLALLVVVLPWERLASFKAAGVEFTLDKSQIDKAIGDLEVLKGKDNVNNESLWKLLKRFEPEIKQSRGGRILWIDDSPYNILGERRLLRILGIETVMATSNEGANLALNSDGDFDLIISDMRSGDDFRQGKSSMPEAVQFIKSLRGVEANRQSLARYSHISSRPIIIYSGKDYNELLNLTDSIRGPKSTVLIVKGVERLFEEILRNLSIIRSEPILIKLNSDNNNSKK